MNHEDDTLNDSKFWTEHDTRQIDRVLGRYSMLFTARRFVHRYGFAALYVVTSVAACLLLAAAVVLASSNR